MPKKKKMYEFELSAEDIACIRKYLSLHNPAWEEVNSAQETRMLYVSEEELEAILKDLLRAKHPRATSINVKLVDQKRGQDRSASKGKK